MESAPIWTLTPTIPPPAERRPLDDPEMHGYRAMCVRVRELEQQLQAECQTRRMMIDGLQTCIHQLNLRIEQLEAVLFAPPTENGCRCIRPVAETSRRQLRDWLHVED